MFLERAAARVKALNHRNLVEILFRTSYMTIITLGTIAILGYGSYQVFVTFVSAFVTRTSAPTTDPPDCCHLRSQGRPDEDGHPALDAGHRL